MLWRFEFIKLSLIIADVNIIYLAGFKALLGPPCKSILLLQTYFSTFGGRGFTRERSSNFINNRFFEAEKLPEKLNKPYQQGRIL